MTPAAKSVYVPEECDDSDGDRVLRDVRGFWINLARCKFVTEEQLKDGDTDFCDEIRAFGKCPKGYK
jgi:hypothetical protein